MNIRLEYLLSRKILNTKVLVPQLLYYIKLNI